MSLYRFARFLIRCYFGVFYRFKVYGLENGHDKAAILASNHASYYDPLVLGAAWPDDVHFLANKKLFDHKFFGALIRRVHAHPLNVEAANLNSMKVIAKLLKEGKEIVLFPEGTRSFDGELLEGQPGVAMFAMHAQCRIIPIYIHGTHDVYPRGRSFPKLWGKIACVVGKAIHPENFTHLDKKAARKAITDEVMHSIAALKGWYLTDRKGPLP